MRATPSGFPCKYEIKKIQTATNFQDIDLKVEKTEPWVKGDTASGDSKPATLETGYVLNVPPFIEEGELIRIDTRTGEYVERVKT